MKNTGTLKVTTPTDREIVLTRVFDAPRTPVWEAMTKPELLKRWLSGPPGWAMSVCEEDQRVSASHDVPIWLVREPESPVAGDIRGYSIRQKGRPRKRSSRINPDLHPGRCQTSQDTQSMRCCPRFVGLRSSR